MSNRIGKPELAAEIAEEMGMSRKDVEKVLGCMTERIQAHVKNGHTVAFNNFGTWERRERQARTGVKPGTTEKIKIAGGPYPAFKPSDKFKQQLQNA